MKANSNIALEFMQMLSQILEAGKVDESTEPVATTTIPKEADIGKNQTVNDYPESPLRFGGMGRW